jgi:hypothetical protein
MQIGEFFSKRPMAEFVSGIVTETEILILRKNR